MMIGFNWKYFAGSAVIVLALCVAQISGSSMMILACGMAFLAMMFIASVRDFTLPLALFYLPWSPLLKISPGSFSLYTVALVMICAMKAVRNLYHFKRYHLTAGVLLLLITLLSKLINGYFLALDYICFILMIVIFPIFRRENVERKYDFYGAVIYFAAGIIIAALCAQEFAAYGNIEKYIEVHSYSTIVRKCGFYGDPNFYTAQITAAIGGGLVLLLKERKRVRIVILCIALLCLLYCGFLSGSKSFALVSAVILVLWVFELLKMRGRLGLKSILIVLSIVAAVYIATSSLFGGLIDVLVTRFSSANDFDSFTTGRVELWVSYVEAIVDDWKTLLLGKGFTNVKVDGRAAHNTILQMIYQFGILGSPVLIGWMVGYWKNRGTDRRAVTSHWLSNLALMVGAFLPWMAIDALFFDEFFLLQWYCCFGMQTMSRVPVMRRNSRSKAIGGKGEHTVAVQVQ